MGNTGHRRWVGQALIVSVCVALAALIGRLVYIQTKMRPQLQAWSEPRQYSTVALPARRGTILDRRHRVLAGSQNRPTVYADPRLVEDKAGAAELLATVLPMSAEEIRQRLEHPSSRAFTVIQRAATDAEAEGVRSLDLPGVALQDEPARTYPLGALGAHVVGFCTTDGQGLAGIELACDTYLRGRPGRRVVFRDVQRRAVFQQEDSFIPPRDGMQVLVTIDVAIQEAVEREVRAAVEQFQAESGVGLVMDPKTGEVLALTSYPTYEPALAREAKPDSLRNRVLTDPVEPGSVFKPFVMITALAEGVTHPAETIHCHDGLYVTGKRRLQDHHPYGSLTTEMIMAKSSNIGMAIIGQRLGNARMCNALAKLGFDGPTGIDLPGEGAGLLMPLKAWNSFSTTSVPMGHELAVTPMQIITAFCALVNGGHLLRPRVVRGILDEQDGVVEDRTAVIDRGLVVDPAAARTLRDILITVVNEGTGKPCQLEQWQVLGKTGTAEVPWKGHRGYEPDAYLGSFIAAAPASDPSIAVLVMIRKPRTRLGYYGSVVAAPAVKAILEMALPYMNVPPDKPTDPDARLAWRGG